MRKDPRSPQILVGSTLVQVCGGEHQVRMNRANPTQIAFMGVMLLLLLFSWIRVAVMIFFCSWPRAA
jgi:hypothetical protein